VRDTVVVKVQVSKTIEQIYVVRRVWSGMQGGVTHDGVATARSKSRNPSLIFSTSSSVPTAVAPAYTSARALICGLCAFIYLISIKSFKDEFEIEKKMEITRRNQGRQAPNCRPCQNEMSRAHLIGNLSRGASSGKKTRMRIFLPKP
jgi:hypothetical protein